MNKSIIEVRFNLIFLGGDWSEYYVGSSRSERFQSCSSKFGILAIRAVGNHFGGKRSWIQLVEE